MLRRFLFVQLITAVLLAMMMFGPVRAESQLKVVATFSILGDMVRQVGGDRVKVTSLVGPDGDTHVYRPTPKAAKAIAQTKVLFINGLEFEGWIERLVESSGFKGRMITATAGVEALKIEEEGHDDDHDKHGKKGHHDDHDKHGKRDGHEHHHHGEYDPHAWHSLANARIYVRNIVDGLAAADPQGAKSYRANAERYIKEITSLELEMEKAIKSVSADRRKVITSHDAFGYLGSTYGIKFLAPVGVSTDAEASAGDVAKLIRQIKKEKISAIFVENISDRRLLDQIVRETGARIGGILYSDALSKGTGPAATYLNLMRHNIRTLVKALGS
ncbi:MAG: putative periplasmic iron-binding protein [Alphaproteobacteria bacterium MarineAlpha3_Bin7]|nr:MAG: putative periplasmic iron-binding protein [Alphaproteobacteria bacterium MarineAlpha3_Bin7]|tara:strand:- start:1989 stop:2978 length:990 start_codon:yes stop_codon:yes gene_type:complete